MIVVYAWFFKQEEKGIVISTGDFVVEMFVSFDGEIVSLGSDFYDSEMGVVVINAFDEESDNYIGDLEVYLNVTPAIPARIRVKVQDEWQVSRYYSDPNITDVFTETIYYEPNGPDTDGYLPFSALEYDDSFNGFSDLDGYLYYDDILPKDTETTIQLVDGGLRYPVRSNPVFYEEAFVYLDLFADIVQANRFPELWEVNPDFFEQND